MARQGTGIEVENGREFRRALREVDREADKELGAAIREQTKQVAAGAGRRAPRRTGALAASYRGSASGLRGVVFSRLPYAPVHEYGGTISPRGTPIAIRASAPVTREVEARQEKIIDAVGDGIERAAKRAGF